MKTPTFFRAIALLAAVGTTGLAAKVAAPDRILLTDGWQLQSSAQIQLGGEKISTATYQPAGWHPATVPSTVIGCLVENKVYPDPFFGTNLLIIPGMRELESNPPATPAPGTDPFSVSWWYRKVFHVSVPRNGQVWLNFDGINYRANIWLNGKQVADSSAVAGAYRVHRFNITAFVDAGKPNVLAVEVFRPTPDNLALDWVDWNPTPTDQDMGLWRDVSITTTGPIALQYPQIVTKVAMPALDRAQLLISADLSNPGNAPVRATLQGWIDHIKFEQTVELAAHETKRVAFDPAQFAQLNLDHPRLWWPVHYGEQYLYDLHLRVTVDGRVSDQTRIPFGVREVTSELTAEGGRLFKINGRPILIRGGAWAADMFLRTSAERERQEIRYVKDMNLNAIRFEGRTESGRFLELCDREGIMVIAGWCCGGFWEKWDRWMETDYAIAAQSLRDQLHRIRNHPCLLTFWYGSDYPPNARAEANYLAVFKELDWPNPFQSSATAKPSPLGEPTGLRMPGPYDYVPPMFWYEGSRPGYAEAEIKPGEIPPLGYWPRLAVAARFNTETSPGPAIPPIESLRRMLPEDHLWPIDDVWDFHAGRGFFHHLTIFTEALNKRLGEATGVEDYAMKAQLMAYDGERAMFEVYARDKYRSTGVIQWMMNNAWPQMIWHLYDYYLRPGGGYFGAKKACEPLHIQYSYDDRSVVVANGFQREFKGLQATATIYNLDLTEKFNREATVDIGPDGSMRVFTLPEPAGLTTTYFAKLTLRDAAGAVVSSNFYWLSTQPDTIGDPQPGTFWFTTPSRQFADFTALRTLPPTAVKVTARTERRASETITRVTITNPGKTLAFFVRLKVNRASDGEEILPVIWEDNYFALLPGEQREISATYATSQLQSTHAVVEVGGWNVTPLTVTASP